MSDHSFFWHDYETFGRVPRRDRPAQFAGVRTDLDLREIEAPVSIFCRPTPDWLPDPESCLLTGLTPQTCLRDGLAEHEFAAQVEQALAAPGTIGLGYNTMRFDDEVTRHLFWRNLIDPYAREWHNRCGRWDLLDVVRCAYALRPEGIVWPKHEDGRPSFKLEHLTAANGLEHGSAHEALSDVRATIALARLIKTRQPRLFDFCLRLRHKDAVRAEIGVGRPFLHVSGMYPAERGCLAVVWPLAPHPTNRNELLVWDLSADPATLDGLDVAALRLRLFTRTDELPEGVERLPIKSIHVNKAPVVVTALKMLTPALQQQWGLDLEAALRHVEPAARRGEALAGIWAEVYARPARAEAPDVDEDLYGGLVGDADRRTLERLRRLDPDALAARRTAFDDPRLDELLFRYRARNFPETLDDEGLARWEALRVARLHHGAHGSLKLADYFERIDALGETADDAGQDLLGELYDYAEQIAPALDGPGWRGDA